MSQSLSNKKILVVCNSSFAFKYFLIPLVNKLYLLNVKIYLIIGKDIQNKELDIKKYNVFFIKMPKRNIFNLFSFYNTLTQIRAIIIKEKFDLIIANNRDASFCTRLSLFFIKRHKPILIYFARGFYFNDSQNIISWLFSYLIEVLLLFKTHTILSQSIEDIKKMKFFLNIFKIKFFWVGNGVDSKFFYKPLNKKKDYIHFVTTCRITPGKGLEDLLVVFNSLVKKYSNIKLTIIGGAVSNSDKIYLANLMNNKSIFKENINIEITGIISDVPNKLRQCNYYIHPSYREGVPKSLLEAMSVGLVVLASNIRGAREIIINEKNGFLYKVKNKRELYNQMEKLINLNQKEILKIRNNSLDTIKDYSESKYLERQLNGIIDSL